MEFFLKERENAFVNNIRHDKLLQFYNLFIRNKNK